MPLLEHRLISKNSFKEIYPKNSRPKNDSIKGSYCEKQLNLNHLIMYIL